MQVHAVQMGNDGKGQVLLFPYYTVNAGYNTLINLVNTTAQAKALRVRFREAANGREVFALNLYLGAHDVWTAAMFKGDESENFFTGLISNDVSCTQPSFNAGAVFFSKDKFSNDLTDLYGSSSNRLHEGFIEVIEMGVLIGGSAQASTIDQEAGMANCQILNDAWDADSDNSYWLTEANTDMQPPTGGIMGNVILIDVAAGLAISEDGIAINEFSDEIINFPFDSDLPNLASSNTDAYIETDDSTQKLQWSTGIDAISAVLMRHELSNEYALEEIIGAKTDWLITLPTKQFYTDPIHIGSGGVLEPFTSSSEFNFPNNIACETYVVAKLYSREEEMPGIPPGTILPIQPPPAEPEVPLLCFSANNINISTSQNTELPIGIFGSNYPTAVINSDATFSNSNIVTPYENGWAQLRFDQSMQTLDGLSQLSGLPMIGFAVQRYRNSSAQPGVLASYAGKFEHKSRVALTQETQVDNSLAGMKISKDRKGQILLFPYYTVRNRINTLLTVVNHSDQVKAVRVAFYEGNNGRPVLSFNLYLSPFDVWAAALISIESDPVNVGSNFGGQQSVKLITSDTSCTIPAINGQEFLPFAFSGTFADGLIQDMARTTEGFIEVVEMGALLGSDAEAATHGDDAIPASCATLLANWLPPSGKWLADPEINLMAADGVGQLSGHVSFINVESGIDMTYNATAINGYSTEVQHHRPGDLEPNISTGTTAIAVIESDNGPIQTTWATPLNAATALFMQTQVFNDFVVDPSIAAQTVWVNSYPTKAYYVDPFYAVTAPLRPFSAPLLADVGACEKHKIKAYNREQLDNSKENIIIPLPPPLPPNVSEFAQDCWSVNVAEIGMGGEQNSFFDSLLTMGEYQDSEFFSINDLPFDSGWLHKSLIDPELGVVALSGQDDQGRPIQILGKPVLGFVAQKYINGTLIDEQGTSVLANYAIINPNKNKKEVALISPE
jgi:hypothetical protein